MRTMTAIAAVFVALGFPALPAAAAETSETVIIGQTPDIGVQLGAGVNTFATKLDKATNPGPAIEVRATYGQRQLVGAEIAYAGSMNDLKDTAGTTARLFSNGGEALLRANFGMKNFGIATIPDGDIIPYVAAGGGFTIMDAVDKDTQHIGTVNGVNYQSSTTGHIPAAVGVEALFGKRFSVGARLGYKYEIGNKVLVDVAKQDVQSWQATGRAGFVF